MPNTELFLGKFIPAVGGREVSDACIGAPTMVLLVFGGSMVDVGRGGPADVWNETFVGGLGEIPLLLGNIFKDDDDASVNQESCQH